MKILNIDAIIDALQSDPTLDPDEVFDIVVRLQQMQAKAKAKAGFPMAALLDLNRFNKGEQ